MQRILFVDDHPAMLSLLQQVAQAEGYACLLAGSGEEALRLMRKEHVDAVVLDVMMPGMDGMEVCRAIRTHSDVPILMLTARTEERDCIEGFNTGAPHDPLRHRAQADQKGGGPSGNPDAHAGQGLHPRGAA